MHDNRVPAETDDALLKNFGLMKLFSNFHFSVFVLKRSSNSLKTYGTEHLVGDLIGQF